MPRWIPETQILVDAVRYLCARQLADRPTTLRQLSQRMGLGAPTLLGRFEKAYVHYVLIPYGKGWGNGNIEILLQEIPDKLAEETGIENQELLSTYEKILKTREAEFLEKQERITVPEDSPGEELEPYEEMDPYAPYRIGLQEFRMLEHQLISYAELREIARERGYKSTAIMRATGGDRMRYKLPSMHWRPYVFRNKKYYLKEILRHLSESDRMYKNPLTALLKRDARQRMFREEKKGKLW